MTIQDPMSIYLVIFEVALVYFPTRKLHDSRTMSLVVSKGTLKYRPIRKLKGSLTVLQTFRHASLELLGIHSTIL